MGNDALHDNPPGGTLHISVHGSDWLWAAFSVFALSLLIVLVVSFTKPRGSRFFHQIAVIVLAVSSIAYFSMASDLGYAPAPVEFRKHGGEPTRQIWYVRYIQWVINLPLLLLELLLVTGVSASDIFTTIFISLIFIVGGLVGSLVLSTYKWGYFTFGVAALFYLWYVVLFYAPRSSFAAGSTLRNRYYLVAGYFSFMLITYPICWACSEGANVISPTSEMVWYGILDLLEGPCFLFLFLWGLRDVDYKTFGLQSNKYVGFGREPTSSKAAEAGVAAETV
ncbi:heat shock protein 30 [Sparassis latifolia]